MPFVLRRVEPRFLCRGHVPAGSTAQGWPVGAELEAVANGALTTSLKQLASLLTIAEDIFAELTAELTAVADRSSNLRQRIDKVEERLATVDPKKVPVRNLMKGIVSCGEIAIYVHIGNMVFGGKNMLTYQLDTPYELGQ
ncbi:Wiskott-Aldrich syndrome protein family member [Apis cerana cerana]|uniref:Wiskott-Aldrich syndrome protein family member n=1 Tax=Apis cerana cerana TaxID=94128 RepID=A0A2A3EL28_APICC|nr:Wiskott-Aldrich syndrome protein family member [Apis cerana cerana]